MKKPICLLLDDYISTFIVGYYLFDLCLEHKYVFNLLYFYLLTTTGFLSLDKIKPLLHATNVFLDAIDI